MYTCLRFARLAAKIFLPFVVFGVEASESSASSPSLSSPITFTDQHNMISFLRRPSPLVNAIQSNVIGSIRRTCFVADCAVDERWRRSNVAKTRHHPSPQRPHPSTSVSQPLIRNANFHSSSTVLMMSKRKKNGSKSKRAKVLPSGGSTSKKILADESSVQTITKRSLEEMFADDESSSDNDEDSILETTQFASEYHAPVMPTECIQALLKQGEWAGLLHAKKVRWRKKRSIIEAKRKRLGYGYDDDDDDKEEEEENLEDDTGEYGVCDTDEHENEANQRPRLFIDGTLGGGGHSQAILQQLRPGDVLIGCDVDPDALSTASNRLVDYLGTREYILGKSSTVDAEEMACQWEEGRPMFIPVQSNFRNLINVLSKVRHPVSGRLLLGSREDTIRDGQKDAVEFPNGANGMLLDLGVSSHQIDTGERGFAFMKEGPLDMRMSGNTPQISTSAMIGSSLTAADICNEFDEPTIIDILRTYGDEPRAKRIASAIIASRPLYTTTDLVHAINSVTPTFARQKRAGLIATSARVFQALRIVVNEEDGALKDVLERVAPWVLCRSGGLMNVGDDEKRDDGILAVLSYHSMEDKMAKRVMRDGSVDFLDGGNKGGSVLERDMFGNVINGDGIVDDAKSHLPFEPVGKPRKATDEEIAVNSRARSATLRVGIRN
jgi:16S rRNA (cytosine1402-N4)-methyltransferase